MSWHTVVSTPSILGESPFWHPHEQTLYWVDIAGFKINRLNPYVGTVETWAMPSEPGCMAPARSGGYVIALRDRVVRARTWGGDLQVVCRFDYDAATTRFNDGKCDALGRLWAGTMFEPRTSASAQLFSIDARGGTAAQVQAQAGNATVANGLDWSPNNTTLYWADTAQHAIRAWDFDVASARMTQPRVFKQFAAKPAGWQPFQPDNGGYLGRPDGATVDAQGNYWVAMYEGQRVLQLSPTGDIVQNIAAPVLCCTMPCLGGEDMKTLYLTSARHGRSAQDLAVQPELGCVFSMRVDVPGLPVRFFED
jgi:sugar lactone lactonase YvrE